MKRILVFAIVFAILGFFIGYAFYGEFRGVDISMKYILFGTDTGLSFLDNMADNLFEEARKNILLVTLLSAVIGILVGFVYNSKKGLFK